MEASRNTDEHRSPTRANKQEGSPSSHGPGYREPQGKAARWTCPQRNNADKYHRSIHTTSQFTSDCTSTKKIASCQRLSLRRAERVTKDTRQKIFRTQHTRLLIKVQNNPHWMPGVMWRRSMRCEVRSRNHFGHHAASGFFTFQTTASNDGLAPFFFDTSKRRERSGLRSVAQRVLRTCHSHNTTKHHAIQQRIASQSVVAVQTSCNLSSCVEARNGLGIRTQHC